MSFVCSEVFAICVCKLLVAREPLHLSSTRGETVTAPGDATDISWVAQLHTANIFSHEDTSTNPSVSLSVKKATEKKQLFSDTHILKFWDSHLQPFPKLPPFLSQSPPKINSFVIEFVNNTSKEPSPISYPHGIYV